MTIYRKIYKKHYGPIPKDKNGRTYDIHHIDGDKTNNNIENLIAVSIQEHYDIHFAQEDWGACFKIAERMKLAPELISELARKAAFKQIEEGKHSWTGPESNKKRFENGTHPFIGINEKRIADGTHNFLGPNLNNKRVADGTHHLLGPESNRKKVADGTHNLLGPESNRKRIENGTHNLVGRVTCRDKKGKIVQVLKDIYQKQKEVTKDQTQWEFVAMNSNEEKKRRKNV
jgi:hypothetical protein